MQSSGYLRWDSRDLSLPNVTLRVTALTRRLQPHGLSRVVETIVLDPQSHCIHLVPERLRGGSRIGNTVKTFN